MASVLILGMPKSGTSALYSSVRNALPDSLPAYEPTKPYQFDFIRGSHCENRVVKILYPFVDLDACDLGFFDKKILIVRDPRDCLVSLLLFKPFLGSRFLDSAFLREFVGALRAKEAAPRARSVRSVVEVFGRHGYPFKTEREHRGDLEGAERFLRRYPDTHVVKYEDYVAGRIEGLTAYTGLDLDSDVTVSKHISYTRRAGVAGAWRHWFTPDDVDHYRPILSPYMNFFEYREEWGLETGGCIDPNHSSLYVERHAARLRRLPNAFGPLRPREFYTTDYIDHLKAAANEGEESAMVELALASLLRHYEGSCIEAYGRYLHEAAKRHNPFGLVHWGVAVKLGLVRSVNEPAYYFDKARSIHGTATVERILEGAWKRYEEFLVRGERESAPER